MIYNDLKGKTALVTGAGKKTGIGYAIAEKLASCGCNVIIADLGAPPAPESPLQPVVSEDMKAIASELAKAYAVRTLAVAVDVADNQAIGAMVETIKKSFDHIDILCNNAGASFGVPNTVLGYDEAAWMKTIDVNLFSVFRMSRAVLPLMAGKPASIINTASRAGKVPPIFNSAYAVAKAGVIMLTKVMAKELGGGGIRVNAICPDKLPRIWKMAIRPGGVLFRHNDRRAGKGNVQDHPAGIYRPAPRRGRPGCFSGVRRLPVHYRTGRQP